MAKLWICRLLVGACLVGLNNGAEEIDLNLQSPPLLNFGWSLAGDNVLENYDITREVPLDFNITYFGSSYNSFFLSKDGLIGFVPHIRYLPNVKWSEGIRNTDADRPFLAPFYHQGYDPSSGGHSSYQGKIYYRVIYAKKLEAAEARNSRHFSENKELLDYVNLYVKEAVINPPKDFKAELIAVITWEDVTDEEANRGNCDPHDEFQKCESATFQAVIIADKENTFVMFNYLKMDIPLMDSYQAGFNGGYERGWVNVIPCLGDCSLKSRDGSYMNTSRLNDLPNLMGSDLKGRYFLNVGGEEVVRGGCLPPELSAGMLEMYPREVGMFGGEKLEVSGKCLKATNKIYCRFGDGSNTFESEGVMTNDMKGYCPVPLMTIRGSVKLSWSSDGKDWSANRDITVVVPWMVDDIQDQMNDLEINALTQRDSSSITLKWDSKIMSSNIDAQVQIKLIGYRETVDKVEFRELENMGETRNSNGQYTIQTDSHACSYNCQDFQMGLLEVGLRKAYYGDASHRIAMRFGPVPIGWYVNKELKKRMGIDWSEQMCKQWHKEEKKDTDWGKDLPKCPCNLNQALADFGRWQADPACDLFTGSKCLYHKGAKHCVMSIQPTANDAGNLCCYENSGALMYTQLSFQGGGPTKKHMLGAHPYNTPGKVPHLSFANSDIIPYVHCCYWEDSDSDLCHLYTKLRRTTTCENYDVPGLAFVRGETHITTFDGSTYNFGGTGDFTLVDHPDITIQGRFKYRKGGWDLGSLRTTDKTSWKPKSLTHLVIQGAGQVIQVHPAPDSSVAKRGLDIVVGNQRQFFDKKATKWQEFGGEVIINNAIKMDDNPHNNFTIITNNVGINVLAVNNLLHVTVALPPSMKNTGSAAKGMGLLGMFDGKHGNDYITKSDTQLSPGVKPKTLFESFAMSWAVGEGDSLFKLEEKASQYLNLHQYYTYEEIPHGFPGSPSDSMIASTCDKDIYCKWDYRISGSQSVAKATKDANTLFDYSQGSAYKVWNCGLPSIGDMAVLSSYNFSVGMETRVEGCSGDHKFDGTKTFKCMQERYEDAKKADREDYGRKMTENQIDYIIHWVPEPYTICKESDSEGLSQAAIIGIGVGAVLLVIVVIAIIVLVMKKRKGGSKNIPKNTPKPADRVRRDQHFDDGTDEPMMDQSRKPVYKPSKQDRSSSAV